MLKFWNKILQINDSQYINQSDKKAAKLLNRLSLILFLILLAYSPVAYLEGPVLIFVLVLFAFLFLFTVYLNKIGLLKFSRYYFISICLTLVTILSILPGDVSGERYFFIAVSVLPILLFRDKKQILFIFISTFIFFIGVYLLQRIILPTAHAPAWLQHAYYFMNLAIVFLLIYISILYYKKENEKYEAQLIQKNQEIELKNKEIIDSINYAGIIQKAVLLSDKEIKTLLPDSFVYFRPKDIVSGDFYWVAQSSDLVFFAVADCTGHGVPGAILSMIGHDGLNRSLKEFHLTKPSDILDSLTEFVEETFQKSEFTIKDGMDISLCCINLKTNIIEYAGANNPVWIVRPGNSGDGQKRPADDLEFEINYENWALAEIKANKQPIGKYDNRKPFTNHLIHCHKGDCVYIFSDGFADQFGGPLNKKFKYKPLKELFLKVQNKTMEEQKSIINRTFETWKQEIEQTDDVCIIGVKL